MEDKNEKITKLCNKIKDTIDWDFDLCSGYQDMMNTIESYVDEIINIVN